MLHTRLFFLALFSSFFSPFVYATQIIPNKRYKMDGNRIVKIKGNCKDEFGIDNLLEANLTTPAIMEYFIKCSKASKNPTLWQKDFDSIRSGNVEMRKQCLNEKYHGEFFIAVDTKTNQMLCVHPTWLDKLKN